MPSAAIVSNNKRIAKNTIILYLRLIIVLFLTLYISRLVLDVLGVNDFGIYNVVSGFVAMFAFLNASMSNGVQRFFNVDIGANNGSNISEIYTISLYIQFMLAGLLFVIAECVGIWYINNVMVIPSERLFAANWVFQFSVFSFLFVIVQVPYVAVIMAYERMNYYAVVNIVDVVLRFVAVIALRFIHSIDALILYGIFIFLVSIVNFVFFFSYTKIQFKFIKLIRGLEKKIFSQMISFSRWNIFGSFSYMIKDQGLNMLLNAYLGPVVNAARAISYQVASALNGFSVNIFTAFRPQLMQSYSSKDYQRTTTLMFSMSKFTFFLMILISFPVMIEIEYILQLWLGDNIPENTALFTIIIVLNMLVTNFNPPVSQVVHATGKMKKYQIVTSIILTSMLPISWVFLHFGASPETVFGISLIISIINQIVCLIVLKGIFEYSIRKYLTDVMMPCVLVSIVVLPFSYGAHKLMDVGFLRLILVTLINIVLSAVAIFKLGLNKKEQRLVTGIIMLEIFKKHK